MVGGRQGAPGFDPRLLRSAREAAQLSQTALAKAADVHVSSIEEWEAGRQVPRVENVAALAQALRLRPGDLLRPAEGVPVRLQQLRAAAGKSQQQVALAAGLLRTTYSSIERGETGSLTDSDARALADALGVTVEQVRDAHQASRTAYRDSTSRPNRHNGHDSGA